MSDLEIESKILKEFDLTVKGIIEYLDLRKPVYTPTASYGHFGLNTKDYSWEKIQKLV
jgi:S-adenosylmethionine synthetase